MGLPEEGYKCKACGEKFGPEEFFQYATHVMDPGRKEHGMLVCPLRRPGSDAICGEAFMVKEELKAHMNGHPKP